MPLIIRFLLLTARKESYWSEAQMCSGEVINIVRSTSLQRARHTTNWHIPQKQRNISREYWGKPEATAKEFTSDGWFRTGDTSKVREQFTVLNSSLSLSFMICIKACVVCKTVIISFIECISDWSWCNLCDWHARILGYSWANSTNTAFSIF